MSKNMKTTLLLASVAVALYLGWRWYENRQATSSSDTGNVTGTLGSNLNSIAPDLVGGSTGPTVQPAVSVPVTVQYTEDMSSQMPQQDGSPMLNPALQNNPVLTQAEQAAQQSDQAGQSPTANDLADPTAQGMVA